MEQPQQQLQQQSQSQVEHDQQQGRTSLSSRPYWKRAVTYRRSGAGGRDREREDPSPLPAKRMRSSSLERSSSTTSLPGFSSLSRHLSRRSRSDGKQQQQQQQEKDHHRNTVASSTIFSSPTRKTRACTNRDIRNNNKGNNPDDENNNSPDFFTLSLLEPEQKEAVATVERYLLHMAILLMAYALGVYAPTAAYYPMIRRLAEYLVVAWLTCRLILFLSHWNYNVKNKRHFNSLEDTNSRRLSTNSAILQLVADEDENIESDYDEDLGDDKNNSSDVRPNKLQPQLHEKVGPSHAHAALESLYIIDTSNGQRLIPNTLEQFYLDNDIFHGQMLTLIRTPNVDSNDDCNNGINNDDTHPSQSFDDYFKSKQRRFEFQWQIRLKRKPHGKVYFACELEDPVKMGVLQRAFVGAAMAFVKRMSPNNNFAYSITGSSSSSSSPDSPDDVVVMKPHMAFGVETGMPRIVVTKAGEVPPELGQDLVEDPEHLKRRLKTGIIDWNTEDIYTMSMYSSYFDFLQWKSLNFPGMKPFGLTSIVGPQAIHLTLYVLPFGQERHIKSAMYVCADLEISNCKEMEMGPAAKRWVEASLTHMTPRRPPVGEESTYIDTTTYLLLEEEDENDIMDDSGSDDNDSYLEEQTIAELGGGLYLRSGDPVVFEVSSSPDDKDSIDGFVCNGGGFAVVQEVASAVVVLEKANFKRNKHATDRSSLIRSGDTVMIKLLVKGASDGIDYKFLSIHRGWWLKWVNVEPKNNGFFTVHTLDTETIVQETQNSYVTIGGSFGLQHKRWNGFHVGVRAQESATYGGRMLGLYDSANLRDVDDDDVALGDGTEVCGGKWMKPIRFCAQPRVTSSTRLATPKGEGEQSFSFDKVEVVESQGEIHLTTLNCSLDVPVWIEMLDRTERRRKLAYVVRVIVDGEEDEAEGRKKPSSYCRLRSGRTLADIIRSGMDDPKKMTPPRSTNKERKGLNAVELRGSRLFEPSVIDRVETGDVVEMTPLTRRQSLGVEDPITTQRTDAVMDRGPSLTDDEFEHLTEDDNELVDRTGRTSKTKGRKIMDQIAKTVNFDQFARSVATNTAKTGKQVVKQSKKVGVTAGKVIIAPVSRTATALQHSKKPPTRDPKSVQVAPRVRASKRRKENDFLAVNRTVRRFEKRNTAMWRAYPRSLAGQVSPSEQSLRTTSLALNRISSAPSSSHMGKHFEAIANAEFLQTTELDVSFLQGGAYQVGVIPPDDQKRLFTSLVARCLWESHWREEWLGVYERKVVLFTPGSTVPSLHLSYVNISSVRTMDLNEFSPLPGYPIAVLETAWQCYYLAFPSEEIRDDFCSKLLEQKDLRQENVQPDKDLWKARFWQGFQDSVEAAASTGNQKWAKIPSGSKSMHRSVMNGRRMAFDVEPLTVSEEDEEFETDRIEAFVCKLLQLALSTTFDTIETDPASFSGFLDMTSQLRSIQLDRLDLAQQSTLCIFANIYHCLLQHALLLTINGPLYTKSVGHFFRTSCYEIGGDVFSLAELYHCVLRGNMSRPVSPKSPYIDIPRKSSAYSIYALTYIDPRIAFVLNTGDISCPQAVPVLYRDRLELQLEMAATSFVQRHLSIDETKRVILLPRVCDVYRNDFGNGDTLSSLSFCARYLGPDRERIVLALMRDDSLYTIKFLPCAEQYHQLLSQLVELSDHPQQDTDDTADEDILMEMDGTESVDSVEFEKK